jgi:hypothetical protein
MQDILYQIIGWLGSGLLIIAYALVSSKKLQPEDLTYQLINLGGAICLLVYALYTLAYPFVLVNFIWLLIGLRFIWKIYSNKKKA